MPRKIDNFDTYFEDRERSHERREDWKAKGLQYLRYLSTRKMECWGFFIAGFLIAHIF